MVCPGCSSIIPQRDAELSVEIEDGKQYEHVCSRCFCKIRVTILILNQGDPVLIKKYKDWINEK